jgi:hypothetical protein
VGRGGIGLRRAVPTPVLGLGATGERLVHTAAGVQAGE